MLQWLADSIAAHRGQWAALVAILLVGSLYWLGTGHLGVHTSRHSVVDPSDPEQARLNAYNARFGAGTDIIAVLQGDDPAVLRQTADAVAERLRDSPLVAEVFYRVDLDALAENGLYYLPTKDLKGISDNLASLSKALAGHVQPGDTVKLVGLPSVLRQLNGAIDRFVDGDAVGMGGLKPNEKDLERGLGFVVALVDELRLWLSEPARERIGLRPQFAPRETGLDLDANGYLVADGGRLLMMQVRSRYDLTDEKFAGPVTIAVQEALSDLAPDGVRTGVTGTPVLVHEEQSGLRRDLPLTTGVSVIGCLLVFFVAYRSLRGTLVVMLPLGVGIAWSLAATAVLIGSLNLMTSIFAVILVGMGIDFSVHLFTRMRDERRQLGPTESVRRAMAGTGPAILMGALTSAAAFAVMTLTDLRATRELGIIAALGLLLVLMATFIILPLALGRPGTGIGRPRTQTVPKPFVWQRRWSVPLIVVSLTITAILGWAIRPIDFNFDVKSYLPRDSGGLKTIRTLEEHGVGGLDYAATQAGTLAESRRQLKALQALTKGPDAVVARIESVFDVMPPDLPAKEAVVSNIRRLAHSLPRVSFEASPGASVAQFSEALSGLLERLRDDLPFALETLGQKALASHLGTLVPPVVRLQKVVAGLTPQQLRSRLTRFETKMGDLSVRMDGFFHGDDLPLTPSRLPQSLVSSFFHPGSDTEAPVYAIRVYPAGDPTNPPFTRRFTRALRQIDPEATGLAITYLHFGLLMQNSLQRAGIWAGLVVLLLVLVDLRRLRDVALALIPLLMGGVWMVGLINVFGVDYTFANVLAIPLIIGIGIDSGLHIIHRWRECDGDVGEAVWSTGKAILVSSLTTMIAFGSLMLSRSGGGMTLGLTLVLGVGACMVAALVFLPAFLDLAGRPKARPSRG